MMKRGKKNIIWLLMALMMVVLVGCGIGGLGIGGDDSDEDDDDDFEFISVRPSPDKYTYYVKNYVGQNLASVGYTSMGGDKRDKYGAFNALISIVNVSGEYIDIEDEKEMKKYVVIEQSPEVNTEIKLTYETYSDGEESDYSVDAASIEEIIILVDKVGSKPSKETTLPEVSTDADRYHRYIKDYTGRNLGNVGYISMGGDLRDRYGHGNVKLNIVANDGSYVDIDDDDELGKYIVVGQDVPPDTKQKLVYSTNSDGEEYDSLIDSMSYEEITLYVKKVKKKKN